MRESGLSNVGAHAPHAPLAPIGSAIELTEHGLVYAGGSVLVRMRKSADGWPELAIGTDRARMLAMLSIAFGQTVAAPDLMPHVETAAEHWRRGEKALANLRLVFAGLAGPSDPAASHRVALAACLLDQGWPPAALLEELGLSGAAASVEKYNPNHVPAGHGERSGQFDFRSGTPSRADGRFIVAQEEPEKVYEWRAQLGIESYEEDKEHNRLLPRDPPIPFFGGSAFGPKPLETLSATARSAADKVGPGKGPVYGTKVHTEMKNQIKQMGRDDLHPEQSYLDGRPCVYGTTGSVRVDVAQGAVECPNLIGELKTGKAKLTKTQMERFRLHLPKGKDGEDIPIHEVRP